MHALPLGLKARLRLGASHDDAERQADHVADRIVASPIHGGLAALPSAVRGQANPVREALAHVAPRMAPSQTATPHGGAEDSLLPEHLEPRLLALLQGGHALPDPVREDMQHHFGMDLAAVRIHTDGEAARLNDAVGAHAFALGEHVAFAHGKFAPDHPAGRHLLAHELAHVAQFRNQVPVAAQTPVRRDLATHGHLANGSGETSSKLTRPAPAASKQEPRSVNMVVTARYGQPAHADDIAPD